MAGRTAILIDGPNLYGMGKKLEIDIDFVGLMDCLPGHDNLLRAYYFTITADDGEFEAVVPLLDFLEYNGFAVRSKPGKPYLDGASGNRRVRGYVHADFAVEAMSVAEHVDHLVLVTGDGDYVSLVDALTRRGKRVTIACTLSQCSDDLRRAADSFFDLEKVKDAITRAPRPAKQSVPA